MTGKKINTLSTIGLFLLLEVLAFVSFGLSGSFLVYGIIGIVLFGLMVGFTFKQIKVDGLSSIAFFAIPLVMFGVINAISSFSSGNGENIFQRIMIPFTFLAFAGIGYLSSLSKDFSIRKALMVIYGGIALVTLISYLFTMIEFVPFYTLIHRNDYIYYDGSRASESIGNTAYFLMGFKLQEVSVAYFSLFPSVLSTAVIALLFISPKKEKKTFILFSVYAFIGILALLTMPTKMTIITDVLICLAIIIIILFGKKRIKTKVFSYVLIAFASLFLLGILILFLNAQSWSFVSGLKKLIASSRLLNRIFNANGLVINYNMILANVALSGAIIGYYPIDAYGNYVDNSLSILFDTFITSGLIGFIFIVFALSFAGIALVRYYQKSNDSIADKSLIFGFIVVYFGYSIVNYDMQPYIRYENFIPFFENGLFLIAIFLLSYVFTGAYPLKSEAQTEVIENQKEPEKEMTHEEETTYEL